MTTKDITTSKIDDSAPATPAWDAYSVWLTRVRRHQTGTETTTPETSETGWDAFEIWRNRIKKTPRSR